MEYISDTPSVTLVDPSTIKPSGVAFSDDLHVVNQPDPGENFNNMRDKLDKLMNEVVNKPLAKEPPKEPLKEAPKVEPKAEVKEPVKEEKNEPVPETFTSAKAADWKKLKEARAEAEKKASDYEKKLLEKEKAYLELESKFKETDKSSEFAKQIEEHKTKAEKLQQELETVALERSERFSSHYQKLFDQAISSAKEAVGEANAAIVEDLMNLAPSKYRKEQLNKLRENLEGVDQGQFDIAIREMDKARADRNDALKNSKENFQKLKQLEAEQSNRSIELSKARTTQTINRVLEAARAYESFKPTEDPEHNARVRQNEEKISKFFSFDLPPEEMALMPVVAMEGQRLMEKVVPSLLSKINELETALKATQTATPRIGDGKTTSTTTTQPKGFAESFMENWPGGGR